MHRACNTCASGICSVSEGPRQQSSLNRTLKRHVGTPKRVCSGPATPTSQSTMTPSQSTLSFPSVSSIHSEITAVEPSTPRSKQCSSYSETTDESTRGTKSEHSSSRCSEKKDDGTPCSSSSKGLGKKKVRMRRVNEDH